MSKKELQLKNQLKKKKSKAFKLNALCYVKWPFRKIDDFN